MAIRQGVAILLEQIASSGKIVSALLPLKQEQFATVSKLTVGTTMNTTSHRGYFDLHARGHRQKARRRRKGALYFILQEEDAANNLDLLKYKYLLTLTYPLRLSSYTHFQRIFTICFFPFSSAKSSLVNGFNSTSQTYGL